MEGLMGTVSVGWRHELLWWSIYDGESNRESNFLSFFFYFYTSMRKTLLLLVHISEISGPQDSPEMCYQHDDARTATVSRTMTIRIGNFAIHLEFVR
jgi:hypothetical protein